MSGNAVLDYENNKNNEESSGLKEEILGRVDWYSAVAEATKERLVSVWQRTKTAYSDPEVKQAYYLSMEYLLGPNMVTALQAAGIQEQTEAVLREMRQDPADIYDDEKDPGLGNGGLGRLAACFNDSAANLHLPLQGYGLFFKNGLFKQLIEQGRQKESPDNWTADGNPWGFKREDLSYPVKLFSGDNQIEIHANAHDMMIPSHDGQTVNTLRLWEVEVPEWVSHKVESQKKVDFNSLSDAQKQRLEVLRIVHGLNDNLYPDDTFEEGKNLRLAQEYVLSSASLQNIIARHLRKHSTLDNLSDSTAVQINDTHPALAIPELIRLLCDEHGMDWNQAKKITSGVCNYTNHTLMPEALEKWPEGKMDYVLPRHAQIIRRLHEDLMAEADKKLAHLSEGGRDAAKAEMAIVSKGQMSMAHLAAYYSHKVNGVSAMHTELVFKDLFPNLIAMRGEGVKINHTNGITPRRFLLKANPALAALVTEKTGGESWVTDLKQISVLNDFMEDDGVLANVSAIKEENKNRLAALVWERAGVALDSGAMFDVQVKRIHEYKRQMMNLLHTVALYQDILENPEKDRPAVAKIMAGKAAPGYVVAKEIIALIHRVAEKINSDERIKGKLKLAYIPNYNVSKAEIIIPGTDLSEQISTAGTEASGTGNMKFMLNGAVTIGTLDGANVEIREAVGEENFFLFGATKEELDQINAAGYNPAEYLAKSPRLAKALDFIDRELGFSDLAGRIRRDDAYRTAVDFNAYWDAQEEAQRVYHQDPKRWVQMSLANTANSGRFSSDYTIEGYNRENWHLPTVVPGQKPAALEI